MIVNVSKEEMEAMEARWAAKDAAMAEKMPTEADALRQMFEAWERLKQLGWNDACYCPKDGSMFSVIEPGSTGIHKCNYTGDWPKGHWWIYDGDVWPARPILWRPRKPEDPVVNKGLAMDYDCRCVGHNVEFSGAPQLHRGASAGTQGSASDGPEKGSPNE